MLSLLPLITLGLLAGGLFRSRLPGGGAGRGTSGLVDIDIVFDLRDAGDGAGEVFSVLLQGGVGDVAGQRHLAVIHGGGDAGGLKLLIAVDGVLHLLLNLRIGLR